MDGWLCRCNAPFTSHEYYDLTAHSDRMGGDELMSELAVNGSSIAICF